MRERRYEIVLCRRERDQLTLEMLAATAEIHPGLVEQFVAYGLLEPVEWVGQELLFDAAGPAPRSRTRESVAACPAVRSSISKLLVENLWS